MKQKKRYYQPTISYEDFMVNGSVSADCTFEMTAMDPFTCSYKDDWGFKVFLEQTSGNGCNLFPQDNDPYKLCYHVPIESMSIFGS